MRCAKIKIHCEQNKRYRTYICSISICTAESCRTTRHRPTEPTICRKTQRDVNIRGYQVSIFWYLSFQFSPLNRIRCWTEVRVRTFIRTERVEGRSMSIRYLIEITLTALIDAFRLGRISPLNSSEGSDWIFRISPPDGWHTTRGRMRRFRHVFVNPRSLTHRPFLSFS